MTHTPDLTVKVFADGADLPSIRKSAADPLIGGFTSNPTLMNKAGITNYEAFAREFLEIVPDRPISFEVFADESSEMMRQARLISSWGQNVYVKIPITTTNGATTSELVRALAADGVKQNVTAIFTMEQVEDVLPALQDGPSAYVSIFAGRIADAGIDPLPIMIKCLDRLHAYPNVELIWASPREVFNLVQANEIGCHVITMTPDLLAKVRGLGKDLTKFSLETVNMFYNDAAASGFTL
jgi:transaldolase